MKYLILTISTALRKYSTFSQHARLNLMTQHFEVDLPIIYQELVKQQALIEQLKTEIARLKER